MRPTPSQPRFVDLDRLSRLPNQALADLYTSIFGSAIPAGSYEHARRKIAWHLQAESEGGLPESARQHALAIARDARLRIKDNARVLRGKPVHATTTRIERQDSRLPTPGSILIKAHRGRTLQVAVLDDGFECDGRHFPSLSAVATHITGTRWNGFAFFGLTKEAPHG